MNKNMQRGDVCKVCDRKFYIHEILKDKQIKIDSQKEQLIGAQGLSTQIESTRMDIHKI